MILGFKDRFLPYIEDGSKTHSIRAGNRWRAGLIADCYARPRQKGMRLILRAPVIRVERIEIWPVGLCRLGVRLDGVELENGDVEALFHRDGFRNAGTSSQCQAREFWKGNLPFSGQIIHWQGGQR